MDCPENVRNELFGFILLSGGVADMPGILHNFIFSSFLIAIYQYAGFYKKFEMDMHVLHPAANIFSPPDATHLVLQGMYQFSSSPQFSNLWQTRHDYMVEQENTPGNTLTIHNGMSFNLCN